MDITKTKLKAILFRHFCPTEMELGEFRLGLLETQQQDEIASHIESCSHCQKAIIQIDEAVSLPLAPEEQADTQHNKTPSPAERIKIFVINLLAPPSDILMPSSLRLALRGQDDEMKTQLFQIGSFMVALSFERDVSQLDKYNLIGDVSVIEEMEREANFHFWKAYLWQEDVLMEVVPLNEGGDFLFAGIQSSNEPYELIISSPTAEIHLQHLQIPGEASKEN